MHHILYKQRNIEVSPQLITFCTVAVFLYALTKFWIGTKISAYFEAAFLLPFYYIVFKNWWFFKKSKLTWLCIAMLVVPILQFLVQYYQNPELAMKYQGVDKLFKLTFFIAVAFWLSYNLKLIPWFIAANLIGFFILIGLQENPIESILTMHESYRNIFKGIHHEFMSTYAGITLISCIFLLIHTKDIKNKFFSLTLRLVLTASCILSILFIAFSQTRAIILGLLAAGLLIALYFRKNKLVVTACSAAIIATIAVTLTSNIGNRIENEAIALLDYIEGKRTIPKDNTGYRILSWKIGLQHITSNPILGLGGEANEDAMVNSPEADSYMKRDLHHFHNSIIEFGIAYGLFGALVIFLSIGIFLYYIRANTIPLNLWLFSTAQFAFLYTINIFESYYFYWQGVYLVIWTLSPVAAYLLAKNRSFSIS